MASVDLNLHEVEKGWMPPVCARCGAFGQWVRSKTVVWSPWWMPLVVILTGFIMFIPFVRLLFATVLGLSDLDRPVTLHLPFCERHRNHWRWRSWPLIALLILSLSLIGGGIAGLIWKDQLDPANKIGLSVIALELFAIGAAGIVLRIILGAIVPLTGIRISDLAGTALTLKGVSDQFGEAVVEHRLKKLKAGDSPAEKSNYDALLRRRRERLLDKHGGDDEDE